MKTQANSARTRILSWLLILLGGIVVAAGSYAAPPDGGGGGGGGGPGGGGGGGGQGPPPNPGGGGGKPDKPGRGQGDLYSELVVMYRNRHGMPIFVGVPAGIGEAEAEPVAGDYVPCQQPLMDGFLDDPDVTAYAESLEQAEPSASLMADTGDKVVTKAATYSNPLYNPANQLEFSPVPLGGTGLAGEECDVNPDWIDFPNEVPFGRLNVGRSPEKVLRQQLRDVTVTLDGAQYLAWDAAGRITFDGTAVDSPLQSLALFDVLMVYGLPIQAQTVPNIDLPPLPWATTDTVNGIDSSYLHYAAAALGAAADKGTFDVTDVLNLDLVVYNGRIFDIPNRTFFEVIEGDGAEGVAGEFYFDYSGFVYDRALKFPGCVAGYQLVYDDSDPPELVIDPFEGYLMDLVFDWDDYVNSDVFAFATAADDARRVIAFTHDMAAVTMVDVAGDTSVCTILGLMP